MRLFLLPLVLALPVFAHAQLASVYGTFSAAHITGVNNGAGTTSFWAPGFGAGVTFNVVPVGPVKVGVDLRGSTRRGANGADLLLFGPRVGLKVPFLSLKPYVQASGGYLRTRTAVPTNFSANGIRTENFGAWEVLGGIDYSFVPFFDLRLVEFGGGKGYNVSNGFSQNDTVSLFTVNSGVVFHF